MLFDENTAPSRNNTINDMGKSKKVRTIEQIYQKKSQLEHILLRPDTYVGSVERQTQTMWVFDAETKQVVFHPCTFVPGLYKIFDEIIVNASDNKQRDPTMNKIEVTIDPTANIIRVLNNGQGIPVVIHQEHKIYVPELIFGHLLTGSNFDDEQEKTTGGRNGYGAKLANIFSLEFTIETVDSTRGLKYKQTFRNNMSERSEPDIKKTSAGSDYTCITFKPDLARFKMDCLDADIISLLSKRVYDIAATTNGTGPKLIVSLNESKIDTKTFEKYIGIYSGLEPLCVFEKISDRWEVGVGVSDGTFQQVSYVNSICTIKGGTHVQYIADQIANRLIATVKRKNKGTEVTKGQIKNHLAIYVNALIVNPAFDSQTKETLTTKQSNFGSVCALSENFLKKVEKSGIVENILSWAKFKENAELKKKGGSKRAKLIGISKLDDANCAGTSKSKDCTIILTEGDSAKALAISGLGVVGRDYYGVFPLKGKLLNVREASHAQIMKNEEVQNIAKILGLSFGKEYDDVSSLRYGHIMIMTDQDHDGSHIKGLLINFIHHFWPSLLRIPGFLQQFITPIVKCFKGHKEEIFYTIPEYQTWRELHEEGKGWKIKYYKGLGTSTSAEAKEYFSNLQTHEIDFVWDELSDNVIDMAFSKKRVEDRKQWLLALEAGTHIDYAVDQISYDKFVNHELILFSHADNQRSIPHFMDGFKPSQRKVLYSCFKRNLRQEIKVAQLAGYISEHSAYHHGEMSLTQTIIGMAQNFVGSNNINLLSPCGQFGTRLMGGKDAASSRYVFTKLETITRCIFHPDDDALLTYLDDDGQSIEPLCYVPVLPMALVNGSEGIGTGWSSSVPTYNPRDIIANLRKMIQGQEPDDMQPWFRGFKGEIRAKTGKDAGNYTVSGIIEEVDDHTVKITELPVKRWTSDYKQYLESVVLGAVAKETKEDGTPAVASAPFISDFKENHTDTTVLFTVSLPKEKLQEASSMDKGGLMKKFKLDSSIATTNMNMFNLDGQIHRYESATEIMKAFYEIRVDFYDKRREHLVAKLTEEWDRLDNKVRFILMVISGELVVSNRKKNDLFQDLKRFGFKQFIAKVKALGKDKDNESSSSQGSSDSDNSQSDAMDNKDDLSKGYDYLLSMKIWSLTMEHVQSLTSERNGKRAELEDLLKKSAEDLWLNDLDALELALEMYEQQFIDSAAHEQSARLKAQRHAKHKTDGKAMSKSLSSKGKSAKKNLSSDDEGDDSDDDLDAEDSDFDEGMKKKKAQKAKTATKKPLVQSSLISKKPSAATTAAASTSSSTTANVEKVKSKPESTSVIQQLVNAAAANGKKPPTSAAATAVKKTVAKPVIDLMDLTDDAEIEKEKPTAAVAKKATAKPQKAPVRTAAAKRHNSDSDGEDDSDDDEEEEEEWNEDKDEDRSDVSGKAKSKAQATQAKKPANKSKDIIQGSSSSTTTTAAAASSKPKRATRPVTYEESDDEEDEDEDDWDQDDDTECDDNDDEEEEDNNSDFEEVQPKAKTVKAKEVAKAPIAPIVVPKKATVASTSNTKDAAASSSAKVSGVKRAPKAMMTMSMTSPSKATSNDYDEDAFRSYSPGPHTPVETKKPRKKAVEKDKEKDVYAISSTSFSDSSSPETVPLAVLKKKNTTTATVSATTVPKAVKKTAVSKAKVTEVKENTKKTTTATVKATTKSIPVKVPAKRKAESDDDDEDNDNEDDEPIVMSGLALSKPSRQRKPVKYTEMEDEDEEEEEDNSFIVDDDDDEDDDESDF
eukprot:gene4201-8354_t